MNQLELDMVSYQDAVELINSGKHHKFKSDLVQDEQNGLLITDALT